MRNRVMGRGVGVVSTGLLALSLWASAGQAKGLGAGGGLPTAAHADACEHCGLAFLDIREGADHAVTGAAATALQAWRATPAFAARQAEAARVLAGVEGATLDNHHTLGTVQFLRSTRAFLTGRSDRDGAAVVRGWVDQHAALMEMTGATLDAGRITRDFVTHDGLMRHLTWQQTLGGLDLFGNELRANLTGRGELINISSTFIPLQGLTVPARTLSDLDALRAAAANAGVAMTSDPVGAAAIAEGQTRVWSATPDFGNQDPIETRAVYFARARDQIVPAWHVVVPVKGPGNTYEMVVDATSGEILWRHNRLVWDTTQSATYRIYTSDSPAPGSPGNSTPNGFQFAHVARSLVTVTPASIQAASPNGWIPDGGNTTSGNNVQAYTDAANDNVGDPGDFAVGTPAPGRVFDFAANIGFQVGDEPAVYRDAAITQLFYSSNVYHDRLFAMGFDEASGNFQVTNITGTGTGNDPVRAEAQDGSGTNNANFGTSGADGSGARCQMYLWSGPTPDRDGDFDIDIVYHELTHGLSIRLHRGGLTGTQGGGMGEGWSDFFALCLLAEPTDNFASVYAMGGYATYLAAAGYTNNYHYGIRRFPYSTDFSKSPLTFADCDTAQYNADGVARGPFGSATANAVHNLGEIWCNTLLECRREIGAAGAGFAANQTMMQLVVDGMKLAPAAPNMLQERDAILQSDLVRNGGANQAALWRGFARRGMGFSATSPVGGATAGIVEAFDTPQRVDFNLPGGAPSQFQPGVTTSVDVTMTPFNLTLTPGTQQVFVSVNAGAFVPSAMTSLGGDLYRATIPAAGCFDDVRYYFSTGTSLGDRTHPSGAPGAFFSGQVYTGTTTIVTYDMETAAGWVGGQVGDTATTGQWVRADPEPTAAQPGDDHTAAGTQCWVTGSAAGTGVGSFDVDGGFTTLLSPALALAGQPDALVSYWRWYSNTAGGAPNADTFRIEISADGATNWLPFETVGPTGPQTSGGWFQGSGRVGDFVTPTNATRLRFIADDAGTGSVVEAAVDDFAVATRTCEVTPTCNADANDDGNVDQGDVDYLVNLVGGGGNPTGFNADFNNDGNIDQGDVDALINVVGGGNCP